MTSTLRPVPKSSAAISAAITEPLPLAMAVGPAISVKTPIFTTPPLRFTASCPFCADAGAADIAKASQIDPDKSTLDRVIEFLRRPFLGRWGDDCRHQLLVSIFVCEMFALRTHSELPCTAMSGRFPVGWR